MAADILLGFGDSWTHGDDLDLSYEKTYMQLLGEQFGIECRNLSKPSTSIPHLIVQLREFVETQYYPRNQYHAVFFLSAQERTFLYDDEDNHIVNVSPTSAKDSERQDSYYRSIYNPPLGTFNLNVSILALQQICSAYNIKDYYVAGWQEINLWRQVDQTKFFNHGRPVTTVFTEDNTFKQLNELRDENNMYITHAHRPSGHPNRQGHAKIAQALGQWIKI